MLRLTLALAAIVALIVGTSEIGRAMRLSQSAFVEPPVQRQTVYHPEVVRFLGFNQVPFIVDLLLLRFLGEDPGIAHVQKGTHPPAYFDLKLATELDPAFGELYSAGGLMLAVIRDDDQGARELLIRGNRFRKEGLPSYPKEFRDRFWKDSWQMPFILGFVELTEIGDLNAAFAAFQEAAKIEGAPFYIGLLVRRLDEPGGHFEAAINILRNLLMQPSDERLKTSLEGRLRSVSLQYYVWKVERAFSEFRRSSPRKGEGVESAWARFQATGRFPSRDPEGGRLYVDPDGRVRSTTEYEEVLHAT